MPRGFTDCSPSTQVRETRFGPRARDRGVDVGCSAPGAGRPCEGRSDPFFSPTIRDRCARDRENGPVHAECRNAQLPREELRGTCAARRGRVTDGVPAASSSTVWGFRTSSSRSESDTTHHRSREEPHDEHDERPHRWSIDNGHASIDCVQNLTGDTIRASGERRRREAGGHRRSDETRLDTDSDKPLGTKPVIESLEVSSEPRLGCTVHHYGCSTPFAGHRTEHTQSPAPASHEALAGVLAEKDRVGKVD